MLQCVWYVRARWIEPGSMTSQTSRSIVMFKIPLNDNITWKDNTVQTNWNTAKSTTSRADMGYRDHIQPILRRQRTNFYVLLVIIIHLIVNNRYVLLCFRNRFHNSVRNEVIQKPRTNQNADIKKKNKVKLLNSKMNCFSTAITKNSWQFTRIQQ